ncbi:MAG: TonB family protein [Hyphomicrobium sp.]|uniref:energy transducer TonB family protein n=1 Tax=Hyphomicrobium sp. TaxID=82 RepID=UPI0025C45ED4|nr:TonB family protein [Hyphomicrobium sp.]MBZ0208410.1 TonB family protein [Hyphomicrobium sp.]
MHADEILLAADSASATSEHLAGLRQQRDRVFWFGLAAAVLVHAVAIVGMGTARQRTLGSPDGAADAIAVEIVDGATLKDSMEQPTPATTPPGAQQPTAALPAEQPAQPPPEPEAQPEPQPEVAEPAPAPPEAAPAEKEAPKLTAEAIPALEEAKPDPTPEAAEPKPAEAKKPPAKQQQAKQPPKKRTQTSALDLSVPFDGGSSAAEPGGSSAVQRPPGITRSGENDEFARNVIRALQRTMPRERARGRVTVRIVLNENGSRADVKLLQSGGDPDLDFNVVFAARQTAYPFPPRNSTLVDRTFTVTYIYR